MDKFTDKMYFINTLKSFIELLKKTKIGMKIFIFIFFIIFNLIALSGIHFITVILTNLYLIYTTASVYLLIKIQYKYSEKNNKDNIVKNAEETYSINNPDYDKEFAKWKINFTIYELVILIPTFLSAYYLKL